MPDHSHYKLQMEKLSEPFMCPVPTNVTVLQGAVIHFSFLGKESELFWKATWRQAFPCFLSFPVQALKPPCFLKSLTESDPAQKTFPLAKLSTRLKCSC